MLHPIGTIRTPFRTLAECPRNGRQLDPAPICTVTLNPEFLPALLGLDGFSHLILLYWLDLMTAKPQHWTITPPFDNQPRGVFATRAPVRPNPIGLSVVALDRIDPDGRLHVRYLDCLDGSRLLDIKPYLTSTDSEPDATMGWLTPHRTR
jgi:tRNA-Thr(GGU) m(6)t(6)A37 methyltransferase TsaA